MRIAVSIFVLGLVYMTTALPVDDTNIAVSDIKNAGNDAKTVTNQRDIATIVVRQSGVSGGHTTPKDGVDKKVYYDENSIKPIILECRVKKNVVKEVKGYTWMKGGEILDTVKDYPNLGTLPGGSVLIFKSAYQYAGAYQCLVETDIGIASSQVVTVKGAYFSEPKVTSASYTPTEGRGFELPCKIPKADPEAEVYWVKRDTKDEKVEEPVRDRRVIQSPTGSLLFSNATQEDVSKNTKYVCLAKSPMFDKPVVVTEAVVEKVVPDTVPNKGELVAQYLTENIEFLEGDDAAIYCVYGGTPLAYPNYFKDGVDVSGKPGDRITKYNWSSGRRLTFNDTRISDAGTYICNVGNGVGKNQTHTIRITVEAKPKIIDPVNKLVVKKGEDVLIPLVSSGLPGPEIDWYYNGKKLITSDRVSVSSKGITIKNFQVSDQGFYGLNATNIHGYDYSETVVYLS